MFKKRYRHDTTHNPLRRGNHGQLFPPHMNMYENVPKSEGYKGDNNGTDLSPFDLYRKPLLPNQWPITETIPQPSLGQQQIPNQPLDQQLAFKPFQSQWEKQGANSVQGQWQQQGLVATPNEQVQQEEPTPSWEQGAYLTTNQWQQEPSHSPWEQQGYNPPANQWSQLEQPSQFNSWEMNRPPQQSNEWPQIQNNNWAQMDPMYLQAWNPSQGESFPRPHMFTNPFQNENGQLDVNKTLATVGQFATTIQQISPIIKQVNNLIKGLR